MSTFSRINVLVCACCALVFLTAGASFGQESDASPYRVVWDAPSETLGGTMPLGNGEVSVNAWFEAQARVQLIFGRTDSWDEFGRLAKVGAVEVSFLGKDFDPSLATPFKQTFDATTGTIDVAFGPEGKETRVKLWVDVNRPVAVVEVDSELDVSPRARLRYWRYGEGVTIPAPEVSDVFWRSNEGDQVHVRPDVILDSPALKEQNRICIYQRNLKQKYFDENIKTQGLEDFPGMKDPYVDRTFGLVVGGTTAVWEDKETLATTPGKSHRFEISVYAAQTETFDAWLAQTTKYLDDAAALSIDERRAATLDYWRAFAERSWIKFSPNQKACAELTEEERAEVAAETFELSRGYALNRFMTACQGRGNFPIKFNGGLFTVAPPNNVSSHDYRRWGPGFWWQNTRLPYYATLMSGDYELMKPMFDMYCGLVPLCEFRAKKYFGIDGAYFPECIYFTGEVFPETYGLTPWNERENKLQESGWHMREWVGGLELAFLALRYYEDTLDETFLKERAIPTANSILKFFDGYYKVDPNTGKLWMSPSQAAETWWDCDNPATEISGIRAVIGKLLALPENLTTQEDRQYWQELLDKTPELPTCKNDKGEEMLAAAERYESKHNVETPELYSVFPFRLYSFEKPGLELARRAYDARLNHMSYGWAQDDILSSFLGDAETTRQILIERVRMVDKDSRFPAFWGPNFDWTPDGDHGSMVANVTQSVVMQVDGDAIYLAPSLPKNWDVYFKLRAPKKTIVQGRIVDGKVVELNVEPQERLKDVKIIYR
ncbi:MAG: hypothetical protein IK077_12225 [Thermoguttaceae bacterium]|nr:hypothetical protein [Thermoguttaceae bacterium]